MGKIKSEDLQLNILVHSEKGQKEIAALEEKIKGTTKALEGYKKSLKEGRGDHDTVAAAIKKCEAQLSSYEADLKRAKSTLDLNNMTINELRKNLKLTKIALNNAVPGTEAWKKYNAELQATQARMRELSSGGNAVGGIFQKIKGSTLVAVAAIQGIARALRGAVEKIADFEQANVNLSTVLGVSVDEMRNLTENAKLLGRTTEYTASQVSGLQMELAKLGFNQGQILSMTEPTLKFATAVGTDLSSAASLAGATLRIFGLEAKDTEDLLSVLAVSTNKSALSFSYLQTSMSIVGPVAKAFGFSVRDTVTLLGSLANAGFDASSAATATRNILLNLADSSGKLATALGSPVKTFPELIDGLQTLKEKGVDLNAALELTDKRSVSAFNAFLDGTEAAIGLRDSLEDVNGELDRISEERMNTVHGSFKALQSAWEGFVLAFSNSKGVIKDVLDTLTNGINKVTDSISGPKANNGEGYMLSMVRMYGGDLAATKKAIDEEQAKVEQEVKRLQGYVDNRRFAERGNRENKRRLAEQQALLETIKAAQDRYVEYLEFNSPAEPPDPEDDSDSGSGDGHPKPLEIKKVWSLESDESFLAAKAALLSKFNAGIIKTEAEYNEELYDLEVSSLSARIATNKEKGSEREKLQVQLQDKIMKHEVDAAKARKEAEQVAEQLALDAEGNKTRIAEHAENLRYEKEREELEKKRALISDFDETMENLARKHQNNLLRIQMDAFDRETKQIDSLYEVQKQKIITYYSGKRSVEIANSGLDKEYMREQAIDLAKLEVEYQNKNLERLSAHQASMEKLRDDFLANTQTELADFKWENIGLTEEEYNALQSQIEKVQQAIAAANQTILGDEKTSGLFRGTGGELFGVSQEQWQIFFNRLKEGKLKGEDMVNVLTAVGDAARMGLDITSKAIDLTNAKEEKAFKQYQKDNEKKQKSLQDRLDSGLMTQAQYDAEIEQMKAEQDAKEEEMQLKQAQRAKRMNISQAIIESSLAVLKTYTQWGGWPSGIAPAAIMAAIGATQVGLMAATPAMAMGGMVRADDGKTYNALLDPEKRGYVTGPTVIVGERGTEYVIPAAGLSNPTLAPIIANIENARRAGTLRSIDFRAAVPRAYAGGGFTTAPGVNQVATVIGSAPSADLSRIEALLDAMARKLDDPVPAIVSVTGPNGINEKMKEYDRYRSRGKLG